MLFWVAGITLTNLRFLLYWSEPIESNRDFYVLTPLQWGKNRVNQTYVGSFRPVESTPEINRVLTRGETRGGILHLHPLCPSHEEGLAGHAPDEPERLKSPKLPDSR